MNVKIAADKCKPFIAGCIDLPDHHPEYGKDHLFEMIEKIHAMDCLDAERREVHLAAFMSTILSARNPVERDRACTALIDEVRKISKANEKAMRWLGWLQACIVMGGGATLEQMKRINVES